MIIAFRLDRYLYLPFPCFLKILIQKHTSTFCILNMWKPAAINPSSSHCLTLYFSSHVMYKGRVVLVFHGTAVCLTFMQYMMETLTWVLVYIISVSYAARIMSIFKNHSCKCKSNTLFIFWTWYTHSIYLFFFGTKDWRQRQGDRGMTQAWMWFSMNNGSDVS